jgi:deferrochelatase/peroxidase EfeB
MQIAFTAPGLASLGVPSDIVAMFSAEFVSGLADDESRSRRLGDVGSNAPSQWAWGAGDRVPHLMVMCFAEPGRLEDLRRSVAGQGWDAAFTVIDCLGTSDLRGHEPFGFADGISEPQPDWEQRRGATRDQLEYTNLVALGEFLLGYRNEYGKYTDRPLVDADEMSEDLLAAEDVPTKKDVGRNGTYLVMRDLRQDVRGFWRFIEQHAGQGAPAGPEALAAAFVGRNRNGDPLMPISERPIPGIGSRPDRVRQNQFTYDADPAALRCPFGAHVRRANPRNADYPGHAAGPIMRLTEALGFGRHGFRDDLLSSVRFHRIVRRGREYGPGLAPADALAPAPPDDPGRGLRFICINANISRQFEFLQNAWLMGTKFNGLTEESDPVLGNREPIAGCAATDNFTIPKNGGVRRRISGLPQFVTVRGGAYLFLPSLRALRYFSRVGA